MSYPDPIPPVPHFKGRFPDEVEAVLREAGWFPGRVISEAQALKWLVLEWPDHWMGNVDSPAKSGLNQVRIFPAAFRALREFGGLTFKEKSRDGTWYQKGFTFEPLEAAAWTGAEHWLVDSWSVGGQLFPLGVSHTYNSLLAISGRGQVIDSEDNLIGNTIEEALINLILNRGCEDDTDAELYREGSALMGLIQKHFGKD